MFGAVALATLVHGCLLPDVEVVDSLGGTAPIPQGDCSPACGSGESCLADVCCETPLVGGVCNLDGCGCASNEVCYPDTPATGLQCYPNGGLKLGEACDLTEDVDDLCGTGLGCFGGVCKQYCDVNGDCPAVGGVQDCIQTTWASDGEPITGVKVCGRVCDPVKPATPRSPLLSCPAGFTCNTAGDGTGSSYCLPGGTTPFGGSCESISDCAPGLFCSGAATCLKFCYADADCGSPLKCVSFDPKDMAGAYEVKRCQVCFDDCEYSNDGACDDGIGDNAVSDLCVGGTDCTDCGAR